MSTVLSKRENLLRYLESGAKTGYVPGAFFMHFGQAYKTGAAAVKRHEEFFRFTGMDFVKIQFELDFPHLEMPGSFDLDAIPDLPLEYYEPQLAVVKGLVENLKRDALIVLTLYSPFMLLNNMFGPARIIDLFEEDADKVSKGMERVAGSLMRFVRECKRLGLDGFYHSTQGGEVGRFQDPSLFEKHIKPVDLEVMNEIDESFEFNILHICDYHEEYGSYGDLTPFLEYPGRVVNVSTQIGGKQLTPSKISEIFNRPYMGGMNRLGPIAGGTKGDIRSASKSVLEDAPAGFILGADCTIPGDSPWENLKIAIHEAHAMNRSE